MILKGILLLFAAAMLTMTLRNALRTWRSIGRGEELPPEPPVIEPGYPDDLP
jgi:hypothetical protein